VRRVRVRAARDGSSASGALELNGNGKARDSQIGPDTRSRNVATLRPEDLARMPGKGVGIGSPVLVGGDADRRALEGIVDLSVGIIAFDGRAHSEAEIWVDGDESEVVQAVHVAAHEDPVLYLVGCVVRKWADVRGFEDGQRSSPVIAQRRSYASITMNRKAPWPRRAATSFGSAYPPGAWTSALCVACAARRSRARSWFQMRAPSPVSIS